MTMPKGKIMVALSSHTPQILKLFPTLIEMRLNLIMCRKKIKYQRVLKYSVSLTSVGVFQEGLTSDGHKIPSAAMTTKA